MPDFAVGQAYYIEGMVREMWDVGQPEHGMPAAVAARYIGCIQGNRLWHAFEVWHRNVEIGVLFMTDGDAEQLTIVPVGL